MGRNELVGAGTQVALRDAVLALGSGSVGGRHQEMITFSPALTAAEQCTEPGDEQGDTECDFRNVVSP